MAEENISPELKMKNKNKAKNFFLNEQSQISNYHKTFSTTLNYIDNFSMLASTVTGCISISGFTYLLGITIRILQYN